MKKMQIRFPVLLLCLLLLMSATSVFLLLTPALASEQTAAKETISKVSQVFDAAEPIYQELKEWVAEMVAEDDESDEDITEEDLDGFDIEIQDLRELGVTVDVLLSELSSLTGNMNTSEGKTVLAAREYLTMLKNMVDDLAELLQYSVDLYRAVLLLDNITDNPNSYQHLAEDLYNATSDTLEALEKIKPPAYMAITHEELVRRMEDFREIGSDFYWGAEANDPLKIYSCVNRLGHIARMFELYAENLLSDADIQERQADKRLNGPITVLHDELERNLSLLLAA